MTKMRCLCLLSVLAVAPLAACGDDDEASPGDDVCDTREDISTAFDDLKEHVSDGDFEQAQADVTAMGVAFDELRPAVEAFAADEAAELESQIGGLAEAMEILRSAETESELESGLNTVRDQFEVVLLEISDRLDC